MEHVHGTSGHKVCDEKGLNVEEKECHGKENDKVAARVGTRAAGAPHTDKSAAKIALGNMKRDIPLYNPARAKLFDARDDDGAHGFEKKLLDAAMRDLGRPRTSPQFSRAKRVGANFGRAAKPQAKAPSTTSSSGGKPDLISSMAARLSSLEKNHRKLRAELVAKEKRVMELERRNKVLEESETSSGASTVADRMDSLIKENDRLKRQVYEMEKFLGDYGMVWVGSSGNDSKPRESNSASNQNTDAKSSLPSIDFDLLFTRLQQLNVAAGEGQKQIKRDGKKATFEHAKKLPLAIYRDGILLMRGPFRSINEESTKRFVADILDGYFPAEFQKKYPDGVIFDVKDFSDSLYSAAGKDDTFEAFAGKGNRIGGGDKEDEGRRGVQSLATVGDPNMMMSRDEFLKRLPSHKVSASGKILNIKEGIAASLGDGAHQGGLQNASKIVVETPSLKDIRDGCASKDIATLQVKNDDGCQTLIIKLRFGDTIGALRKFIDMHRLSGSPYEIRTAFPNKSYDDTSQTLQEAGLVPNAVLMLRKEKVGTAYSKK